MTVTAQPQWQTALNIGNEIRIERAELRKRVHGAGTYTKSCAELALVFRDGPPACMATMRVEQALRWVYRMGPARVGECLVAAGCSFTKRVDDLTPRQRDRIVETLEDWGCGRNAA